MVLLDTDTLVHLLKAQPPIPLLSRLKRLRPRDSHISVLSLMELQRIAQLAPHPQASLEVLERLLLPHLRVLPIDDRVVSKAAQISTALPAWDLVSLGIAATCLVHDLLLVTGKPGRYGWAAPLRTEDWTSD